VLWILFIEENFLVIPIKAKYCIFLYPAFRAWARLRFSYGHVTALPRLLPHSTLIRRLNSHHTPTLRYVVSESTRCMWWIFRLFRLTSTSRTDRLIMMLCLLYILYNVLSGGSLFRRYLEDGVVMLVLSILMLIGLDRWRQKAKRRFDDIIHIM